MQRSTGSESYPRDLKGTGKTPTQASESGFSDSNATATPTQFALPRNQTQEAQGSSGRCLHSEPTTCTDVVPKSDQEPPRKYKEKEQVYIVDDHDTDGTPIKRRRTICCKRYYSKEQKWKYRVKDENQNHVGWYWEDELENF